MNIGAGLPACREAESAPDGVSFVWRSSRTCGLVLDPAFGTFRVYKGESKAYGLISGYRTPRYIRGVYCMLFATYV